MPKISIIIPIYNVEKYLSKCLDSIINQTFKDIEIICINDCSPDNSLTILQEYAANDSRIKIIDLKENGGQAKARNLGIDIATGEYICFVDSDDYMSLNMYENLYNQAKELDSDIVISEYKRVYANGRTENAELLKKAISPLKSVNIQLPEKENLPKEDLYKICLVTPCIHPNQLFKADFIKNSNIKFGDTRCYEDEIFILKCYMEAQNVSYTKARYYMYNIHNSSTLRSNKDRDIYIIKSSEALYNYIKENNLMDKMSLNLRYHILHSCRYYMRHGNHSLKTRYNLYKNLKNYLPKKDSFLLISILILDVKNISQKIFSVKNSYIDNHTKEKNIFFLGLKIKFPVKNLYIESSK